MAEPKRPKDGLERVLGGSHTTAILPNQQNHNVRKFRKFPPFHRPVTEDPAFLVRSYTKIVTKINQKMVS